MIKNCSRFVFILGLMGIVSACNSGDVQSVTQSSVPTPTIVVAQYTTPTTTPIPTDTPPPTATGTATNTPAPTDKNLTVTDIPNSETATPKAAKEPATPTATATPTVPPPPPSATPTATIAPTPAPLSGRIAFPIDDGGGHYDIWAVNLPDGEPFMVLRRAHQPNFFKEDGRLLVNMKESELGESIGLLDPTYTWQGILNQEPEDSYPFWHPDGNRYTFSNLNLVLDPDTAHLAPYIFTACSLQLPKFENDIKCQDVRGWGKTVVGEAPVWTEDDRIAFFSYKGDDGIYAIENVGTLREAGGVGSPKLLVVANGKPSDTVNSQVFFSAGDIDGNWEAYSIELDGSNLTNLSNSPESQDGLPTVSPDGNWVAFVSDRDGQWGIWAVPRYGGEAVKLADISKLNSNPGPWGTERRAWMHERISWGPE